MINKQNIKECKRALKSIRKIGIQAQGKNGKSNVTGSFFRECLTTITRA